jgi:hypothetical protein
MQDISNYLPDRQTSDQLLEVYIRHFEPKYRVFHIPSLREEYLDFWKGQPTDQPGFLAQLLLIWATSYVSHCALSSSPPEGSQFQVTVVRWVQLAEQMRQRRDSAMFHSIDMESLQFLCLLVVACRANFIFMNKIFGWTGQLSNLAISMGFHREPPAQFVLGEFQREMRRRLWVTILEISLLASIDRGLTPSFHQDDMSTVLPLDVDDDKLDENTQAVSKLRAPDDTITNMTFALKLHQSFHLRYQVVRLVNGGESYDYLEGLKLDLALRQALADVPEWTSLDGKRGTTHVRRVILQSLLSMHYIFAARPDTILGSSISRNVRLELAVSLIAESRGTEDSLPAWITSDDPVFAAMVICCDMQNGRNKFGREVSSSS